MALTPLIRAHLSRIRNTYDDTYAMAHVQCINKLTLEEFQSYTDYSVWCKLKGISAMPNARWKEHKQLINW